VSLSERKRSKSIPSIPFSSLLTVVFDSFIGRLYIKLLKYTTCREVFEIFNTNTYLLSNKKG
jgi:hypothetical protein